MWIPHTKLLCLTDQATQAITKIKALYNTPTVSNFKCAFTTAINHNTAFHMLYIERRHVRHCIHNTYCNHMWLTDVAWKSWNLCTTLLPKLHWLRWTVNQYSHNCLVSFTLPVVYRCCICPQVVPHCPSQTSPAGQWLPSVSHSSLSQSPDAAGQAHPVSGPAWEWTWEQPTVWGVMCVCKWSGVCMHIWVVCVCGEWCVYVVVCTCWGGVEGTWWGVAQSIALF